MKGTISISEKSSITWVPKILIKTGFKGKVEYLLDAVTVVLIHPDASLEDVEKSLQVILEDIRIRRKLAGATS